MSAWSARTATIEPQFLWLGTKGRRIDPPTFFLLG